MTPYYKNELVTLYLGDCLQVLQEDVGQFDTVISDPPYGTTACKWDSIIPLDLMWKELKRVMKSDSATLLFSAQPFSSALVMSNLKNFRYEWIWEKGNATGHLNAKKAPLRAHENILVFYEKSPTYNPQKTTGHTRKTATRRSCLTPVYGKQEFDPILYDSTERYPRDVLLFSGDKQTSALHPTQKPLELMRYLVRTYTNVGDTILDFVCGSGTTLLAAQLESRYAVGIEINERYCELSAERLDLVVDRKVVAV